MVLGRGTAGLAHGQALRDSGACCSPLVWPRPGPDGPSTVTRCRAHRSGKKASPTGVSSLVSRTPSAPLIGTRPPSPAALVPFHPLSPVVGAVGSSHPLQLPRANGASLSAIRSRRMPDVPWEALFGRRFVSWELCVCVGGGDGVNFCLRSLQRHKGRAVLYRRSHGNSSWDCLT